MSKLIKVPGFNLKGIFKNKKYTIRPNRIDTGLYHGRTVGFGNKISFSEKKTRRTWKPNVQWVKLYSETLNARLRVKATQKALRCIDKAGGLDNYLLKTEDKKLDSKFALRLRRIIIDRQHVNQRIKQREETLEWHAQKLVEQAAENPDLAQILLNGQKGKEDLALRYQLEEAGKKELSRRKKYERLINKLTKKRRTKPASRYQPLKRKSQVPEYQLHPKHQEKLRGLDTNRLDLIYRGELRRSSKKAVEVVEQQEKLQGSLQTTAVKVQPTKQESAPKTIMDIINAASSGDSRSRTKIFQAVMSGADPESGISTKKKQKNMQGKENTKEGREKQRRSTQKK